MGKRRESLLNFNAFVLRLFFVDLRLSQNPYIPTTRIQVITLLFLSEVLNFADLSKQYWNKRFIAQIFDRKGVKY